ncbi:alpha/beta hydrolase [Bosea caraganae]|uniref:Alpha/beta hydrolase n=1 Tax=Bosea caraganae TaxID=2763117 RepID=A0A370L8T1_9HYPH|nr:alpha/beta hydrolase [Bosea caraganae]RDJ26687.1 alpha/beta hydrolase [Bosea caraganae]RDJ30575.1 alpha/beta hydrolase [Bosea caraganae]
MTTTTLNPPLGRSTLPFVDGRHPDRPLAVNVYRPVRHQPNDPVIVVQHGMMRNGDDYRDFWIDAAEKHGLLIVAPTFPNEHFPKAEGYNNGLLVTDDGAIAPREQWLYAVPERVLDALRAGGVIERPVIRIFGHSAGGQFVHRMLATEGGALFTAAMAANSGWYTLPTLERRFPEGLGGAGLDRDALVRWLAYPMIIFAGDRDIVTDDPNLPAQAEALAQGPHRYGRAHFMLDFARTEASRLRVPCNWQLITVGGIGHDGAAMSRAAAAYWFEGGRIPPAEELGRQAEPVL